LEICSENLLEKCEVDTGVYGAIAEEILSQLVGPDGEGSVVFVSDERIRELNRDYRNVDRATDVLSFSFLEEEHRAGVVGDVYISLETARRQAEERGIPLGEEVLRLLVHGLLHLVGHVHDEESQAARMADLEERLFLRHRGRVAEACRWGGGSAGGGKNQAT
jgi:probable rRNA maturation factor